MLRILFNMQDELNAEKYIKNYWCWGLERER